MNHEELAKRFYECLNRRDLDGVTTLLADDVELRVPAFETALKGRNQVRDGLRGWIEAFPDLKFVDVEVSETRKGAMAEVIGSGTQQGALQSPIGLLPPSGRAIRWEGCDIFYIKNGKIYAIRTYNDAQTIIQQIVHPAVIRAA